MNFKEFKQICSYCKKPCPDDRLYVDAVKSDLVRSVILCNSCLTTELLSQRTMLMHNCNLQSIQAKIAPHPLSQGIPGEIYDTLTSSEKKAFKLYGVQIRLIDDLLKRIDLDERTKKVLAETL